MKLLILTQKVDSTDDNLGFFHRWIEEFAKQCEHVSVVCLYEGAHALPGNVRVLSLGKERNASRLGYLRRFYTYIWRERKGYDAVFVHMNQIYVILGGLLWRFMGKRIGLWYAHGTTSLSLMIATLFAHDVFTSTREGFRIRTDKLRIVGQGIDATLFTRKTDYDIGDTFRLVTSGRITPAKGIDGMIDIVVTLNQKKVPTTLDIIGSGDASYTGMLATYAAQKGLGSAVVFRGGMPYEELAKTLSKYDAFLNLGRTGSLDKALLDAAAAGVPVVTTNGVFVTVGGVATDPILELEKTYRKTAEERKRCAEEAYNKVTRHHALSGLVARICDLLFDGPRAGVVS